MIARTKITFVWLWMAALLSASVGVSVQKVYCYCLGITTVSLFTAADGCLGYDKAAEASSPNAGCCSKKIEPVKRACCEKTDSEKKGCTKKTTQVFQLKTAFEVGSSDFKKFDFPKIWIPAPSFLVFSPIIWAPEKAAFQDLERPPPTLSGRMICVRHGVFRC